MWDEPETRREIRGYQAVREAAKDTDTYSSDLIGDRDTRDYRQLPLELDPPRHTLFRAAVQPIFMSNAIEPKASQFEQLALDLMEKMNAQGGGEVVSEFALPYVMGCLTIIYNRPQDYDEWLSWGPDVWTAEAYSQGLMTEESLRAGRERSFEAPTLRSGATLEAYLVRVFDAATPATGADPGSTDIWDWVAGIQVNGESIAREEMFGIANVLLAGGRDTVIKLVSGLTWHLVKNPADRDYLTRTPEAFNRTIAEMVRFLSPLPKMERVLAEDKHIPLAERDPKRYVLLNYLSANHDKSIWHDADEIDIHRERKPHLAFGFGRHSCMGMNITEHEARAFLRAILENWPGWTFDGEPEIEWETDGLGDRAVTVLERFVSLRVVPTA